MGAPVGNKNATKSKPFLLALERALKKRSIVAQRDALDEIAEQLLAQCDKGELPAIQELANRLDGRPAQSLTVSGDVDNPLTIAIAAAEQLKSKLRA